MSATRRPDRLQGEDIRRVAVVGDGRVAEELIDLAADAEIEVVRPAAADVVLEVGSEGAAGKRRLLAGIGERCRPEVPVLTLTRAQPVLSLALAVRTPSRVLGFNALPSPATTRVIEVARHPAADGSVLERAFLLWRLFGKTPICCGDRAGMIAARVMLPYVNDAARLLMSSPDLDHRSVDRAMRLGAGLPRGPFELAEHMGIDLCITTLRSLHERTADPRLVPDERLGRIAADAGGTPPRRSPNAITPKVRRIGVLGTGQIGSGIAAVAAGAGFESVCWGRTPASLDRGRAAAEQASVRRRGMAAAPPVDEIRWTTELEDLASCDLVVEAVVEDRRIKEHLLAQMAQLLRPTVVLATATSALSVTDLGRASGRPETFIGLHFFNPVPVMRLVEVVPTAATDPRAVGTATWFVEHLGKTWVRVLDTPGFVVNRLLFPMVNDAFRLVEDGYAAPEDIDAVVEGAFGHPLGPLALADLVGLDVTLGIVETLGAADPLLPPPVPLLRDLVDGGFLGRKTARGLRSQRDPAPTLGRPR